MPPKPLSKREKTDRPAAAVVNVTRTSVPCRSCGFADTLFNRDKQRRICCACGAVEAQAA